MIFYKIDEVPVIHETRHYEDGDKTADVRLACFGDNISAITCDFPKGYTFGPHNHPHEQLCVCIYGALQYTIDGETYVMRAGDTAHLKSEAMHEAVCLEDTRIVDIFTPVRMDQMAWYDSSIKADIPFIVSDRDKVKQ